MAYQSLYRRYRPQSFEQIQGQHHVVSALQNAVVKGEVGHAYLFHGPRGTGKTTSARVLAKALNCENLSATGEPCGTCDSCVAIEQGRSFDLHELDAASNNKVEDMRDLLAKVNLGTPGRAKVYILDEVHMLTSQAENAVAQDARGATRACDVGARHHRTAQGGRDDPQSLSGLSANPARRRGDG